MSVLIRGMEMPKDGTGSVVHIYSDGHISMPFWGKGMQIVSGITAVPVPPHGRLLKVLKTERECVSRDCNLDCGKCDLSLEQDEVLRAYDTLIALFADQAEEGET